VSGTYAEDQVLSVEAQQPQTSIHYSIRDPDGAEGPWIPYREPVLLSAARGEEREYRVILKADGSTGEIERREFLYRIDKRPPAPPVITPRTGQYWDAQTVTFIKGSADIVYYTLQGDVVSAGVAWNGAPISVGRTGEISQIFVQAFAQDPAGNKSPIATARYTIDLRPASLDILSPVPGSFANPQLLAMSFRNVQWVRYTLDGSDPLINGTPYTGPVLLTKKGETHVRVAAQPRSTQQPVIRDEATAIYQVPSGTGLSLDVQSGSYPSTVTPHVVTAPDGSLYYAMWEKSPTESDFLASAGMKLVGSLDAPRTATLRLRALSDSGSWGPEYRYFYFIGSGGATPPTLTLQDAEPVRGNSTGMLVVPAESSLISVTTSGAAPNLLSPSPAGLLALDAKGTTSVSVQARAMDGSGVLGAVVQKQVAFGSDPGTPPSLASTVASGGGSAIVDAVAKEQRALVYEITSDGSDPSVPSAGSPRLSLPLSLSLPFGTQRVFKIRSAALDSAGRVLAPSTPLAVTVDRRPPPKPTLTPAPLAGAFDAPLAIAVGTTGKVFYTVTSDGTNPRDPGSDSTLSSGTIALPGVEGSLVAYRVKLMAIDALGNATESYGPYTYLVDLRTPALPAISGIADGGKYNKRQISPVIAESPWNVRYTTSQDGSAPPEPDASSPLLTAASVFSGEEASVTAIRVKLLAISHNGKRLGERKEMAFAIDLKPPEVPKLAGAMLNGRYAQPVTLTAETVPADVHIYLSIASGGGDPGDPVAAGQIYGGPVTVDVPDGMSRDFSIRVATVDDAGNRSLYERRYAFTVDRELPDDPEVGGAPAAGVSDRPVTLTISAREGTIVYELTEDGSQPHVPTATSTPYLSPILLIGRDGAAVTYRLLARAFNDLGSASRAARIVTVTVDRSVPPAPQAPRITYAPENPLIAYVTWEPPSAAKLLFRLKSSGSNQPDFGLYTGPISVTLPAGGNPQIAGEAVLENAAGTRGPATVFTVNLGSRLPTPTLKGARDGGLYTQKVELSLGASSGSVHYEIATDGQFPPAVTAASPLVPNPFVIDTADGQTLTARIALRAFDPSGIVLPSSETRIGFTIDKTPPDPPYATGIDDGGYYQDSRSVTFLAPEGSIYYTITTGSDALIPAQTDANLYKGDVPLPAVPGTTVTYRLVAFTVDEAGNRSREIRSWNVTIDQKIVYLSTSGNDYADGSRSAPVRTMSRALQLASSTTRKTIFAAQGVYRTDSQINLDYDVTLVGGLDGVTWMPLNLGRVSVLTTSAAWRSGDCVLSVSEGSVTLRGFDVQDATGALPSIVALSAGKLSLDGSSVSLQDARTGAGIFVSGGSLSLTNSSLQASSIGKGALIQATGGRIAATGSTFTGPREANDFACLDLSDVPDVSLKGVTIDPGAGQRTRAIRSVRAKISLVSGRLVSGEGTIEAIAVDAKDSDLEISDMDIATSAGARSPTAILSTGSGITISGSRLVVSGTSSAVGVSARGGELALSRSTVRGKATAEYLALLRLEDTGALVSNNLLLGADAGESVVLLTKGGTIDIVNNTIIAGTGATLTTGIYVQGDVLPRIVNNVLIRMGEDRGSAIQVLGAHAQMLSGQTGGASVVLLSNSFSGWQRLARIDYAQSAGLSRTEIITTDGLNAADGDPFAGSVAGNIAEQSSKTFRAPASGDYRPQRSSATLDAGIDITTAAGMGGTGPVTSRRGIELAPDFNGKIRPAAVQLETPGPQRGWDIGAYEYSD